MIELKNKKPRDFWKHFKTKCNKENSNISAEEFKTYFSELYSGISTTIIDDVESFNESSDFNVNNPTFHELNVPISVQELEEVTLAAKNLKQTKSASPSNEYFIETILGSHLTDLFNKVFLWGN